MTSRDIRRCLRPPNPEPGLNIASGVAYGETVLVSMLSIRADVLRSLTIMVKISAY